MSIVNVIDWTIVANNVGCKIESKESMMQYALQRYNNGSILMSKYN